VKYYVIMKFCCEIKMQVTMNVYRLVVYDDCVTKTMAYFGLTRPLLGFGEWDYLVKRTFYMYLRYRSPTKLKLMLCDNVVYVDCSYYISINHIFYHAE
jgi:hypothetical protein